MILDSLPDEVLASWEIRNASWVPGSAVRVSFLDGDTELHEAVAKATDQITEACNLVLNSGADDSGAYRRWREDDQDCAAEIRVSFDLNGYFSLVGTDSTDRSIGLPGDSVGGWPNQRSLNLGGFTTERPGDWEGTVRHEFLHALAFHHSHQNLRGPCEVEFRWGDDPGYIPTRNPLRRVRSGPTGPAPGHLHFSGRPAEPLAAPPGRPQPPDRGRTGRRCRALRPRVRDALPLPALTSPSPTPAAAPRRATVSTSPAATSAGCA